MRAYPFQIGDKYNHWELLKEVPSDKHHRQAEARCACGVVKVVNLASVRAGQSRSCGQCRRSMYTRKHGGWKSAEYTVWSGIKQRCYNPKSTPFHNYGARGITMCERWRDSFEDFLADVGKRPSKRHSLDRVHNDGNYEPGNVRWATAAEQQANKRSDIWQRIVLLLAGAERLAVLRMVAAHEPDHEIAQYIARHYLPMRAAA